MKKGKTIGAILLTAAAVAVRIMVELNKKDLIIENGVSSYRNYASASTALLGAAVVLTVIMLALEASAAARSVVA